MPKPHRDLIKAIQEGPSIKEFVHNSGSSKAVECFNNSLMAVKGFRDIHLQIVTRYIIIMSQKSNANKKYLTQHEAGTGGSGFMTFLKGLRDATICTMLGRDLNEHTTTADAVAKTTNGAICKSSRQDVEWSRWKKYIAFLTLCVLVVLLIILIIFLAWTSMVPLYTYIYIWLVWKVILQ
eukprot:XP_011676711.1 PREDICTED: indoleamine 2,3-dioxygenase 1-like isoform X1 [Strongylocentrotus purpuratus]